MSIEPRHPLSPKGEFVISYEFFPPKTPQMETQLWESVKRLEQLNPHFVSVTYGAGGSTRERTHAMVLRIAHETHMKPAAHLTCVASTQEETDRIIRAYWEAGVRHIVALRGDPPGGVGTRTSCRIRSAIRRRATSCAASRPSPISRFPSRPIPKAIPRAARSIRTSTR